MAKQPKTLALGEMIDTLYTRRAARIEKQREVDQLKVAERELHLQIMVALKDQKTTAGRGQIATASIVESIQPQVASWPKLYAYIKKHDAFYLLHQRVASKAWSEMVEAGKKVPGVDAMSIEDLSLTKATKG